MQNINDPLFVRSNVSFVGAGEENVVLAIECDGQNTVFVRISHRQPSVARRACRDLADALGAFSSCPSSSSSTTTIAFSGTEVIDELNVLLSDKCEGLSIKLDNSRAVPIVSNVLECAFLSLSIAPSSAPSEIVKHRWFGFEIKPKWGSRARIRGCFEHGPAATSTNNDETQGDATLLYELPAKYWTHSKFALKQRQKEMEKALSCSPSLDSPESSYDPETLFAHCCDPAGVHSSILACAADQEAHPATRNNFALSACASSSICSSSNSSGSRQTNVLEGMIRAGSAALVLSGVLPTILEFQERGMNAHITVKTLPSRDEEECSIPFVLEAPMLEALSATSCGTRLSFVMAPPHPSCAAPASTRAMMWTDELRREMTRRLYNATAARDVSIVISFAMSNMESSDLEVSDEDAQITALMISLAERDCCGNWSRQILLSSSSPQAGVFQLHLHSFSSLLVKVCVIDLDDKSEYRTVAEISKRDAKLFA